MEIPECSPPKTSARSCDSMGESFKDACIIGIVEAYTKYGFSHSASNECELSYEESFRVIRRGNLEKKTLNASWQLRYFELTPTRLLYFSGEDRRELKGCFNLLSLLPFRLTVSAHYPEIRLVVRAGLPQEEPSEKVLLRLQLTGKDAFAEWEKEISDVLAHLKVTTKMRPHVLLDFPQLTVESLLSAHQKFGSSNCNFWNQLTISVPELLRYSSHLDVLFMRSRNPLSCLHRFFMRSHYDHVAVLLKNDNEQVYVLEAIQAKGVCVSSLQDLLSSFGEEYEEMGYRRLIVANGAAVKLDPLESYINSLLGKKYELSLSKLLLGNDDEDSEANKENVDVLQGGRQERTYFCSELIADIYLKFGVLLSGKSSQFWPKDFEEDALALSADFSLSPLMRVEVEKAGADVSALSE